MTTRFLRQYGLLVMETVAPRALIFVGDAPESQNVLRRGVGQIVRGIARVKRDAIAEALSISPRTLDDWIKASVEEDRKSRQKAESENNSTVAARIFFAAGTFLQEAHGEYRSLGSIVDYVKKVLRDQLTTEQIRKQLDAYVALSILEHHPDDSETYRLVTPNASWSESTREHMHKTLHYIFPAVFDIGYQTYVGTLGGLARLVLYEVPEDKQEEFTHSVIEEMRGVMKRLDSLSRRLREENPEGKMTFMKEIFLAGYSRRDDFVEELLSNGNSFRGRYVENDS